MSMLMPFSYDFKDKQAARVQLPCAYQRTYDYTHWQREHYASIKHLDNIAESLNNTEKLKVERSARTVHKRTIPLHIHIQRLRDIRYITQLAPSTATLQLLKITTTSKSKLF